VKILIYYVTQITLQNSLIMYIAYQLIVSKLIKNSWIENFK